MKFKYKWTFIQAQSMDICPDCGEMYDIGWGSCPRCYYEEKRNG